MSFTRWRSLVDGAEVDVGSEIPDSGLTHEYDARELGLSDQDTIDPFSDNVGSKQLDAVGGPIYNTEQINGNPVADYEGVDDYHEDGSPVPATDGDEFMFAFVIAPRSDGSDGIEVGIANADSSEGFSFSFGVSDGEWRIAMEGEASSVGGFPSLNDPHAGICGYDGSNLILEVGETEVVNQSQSTTDRGVTGFSLGYDANEDRFPFDCQIGHVRTHDEMFNSQDRGEYISALESSWGFTTPSQT